MKLNIIKLLTGINLVVFAALAAIHYLDVVERNAFLIRTYEAETKIMTAQVLDMMHQRRINDATEYQKGFEAGKTQTAISFLHSESLVNYSDGYHAAVGQFGVANPHYRSREEQALLDELEEDLKKMDREQKEELIKTLNEKQKELLTDDSKTE